MLMLIVIFEILIYLIIFKRYSDFVVHEIDKDDQVIQLTDVIIY